MSKGDKSPEQRNILSRWEIARWGGCPECGGMDGMINIGPSHWHRCDKHKVKWWIGSNLFSGWRDQTEDEQRKIYNDLGMDEYREIMGEETQTHPLVRRAMLPELMENCKCMLGELLKNIEWMLDVLMKESGEIVEAPEPNDPPF